MILGLGEMLLVGWLWEATGDREQAGDKECLASEVLAQRHLLQSASLL